MGPEFNQGGEDLEGLSGEAESIGKELEGECLWSLWGVELHGLYSSSAMYTTVIDLGEKKRKD